MEIPNNKILLVLDLDETLIYADKEITDNKYDFEVYDYKVKTRPYLKDFLISCNKYFNLAIWSSASDEYVEKVVSLIKPESIDFKFIWGRSKATFKAPMEMGDDQFEINHENYIKRLKKIKPLGFTLDKALIVDDSPFKSKENYGNAIYINEFKGQTNDKELMFLEKYLIAIKDCTDVRKIEKRGWRLNV